MDELAALVKTPRKFRECSMMCFTGTWLHLCIPDSSADWGVTDTQLQDNTGNQKCGEER